MNESHYTCGVEKEALKTYQVTKMLPPWFLGVLDAENVSCYRESDSLWSCYWRKDGSPVGALESIRLNSQVFLISSNSSVTFFGSSCSCWINPGINSACLRTVPALAVEVSSYNCSDAIALNTVLPLRFISGRDCCIFATVICNLVSLR
jgi:hypothetical protein